jgi:hypothetical protein
MPADPDHWAQLLAASEGSRQNRMGQVLSRRGARIAVAVAGAAGIMLVLTLVGVLLGVLAG